MKIFLVALALIAHCHAVTPIVLMHGLLASKEAMSHAERWILGDYPTAHILNCEIGNGRDDSLFMNINHQVEELAKCIQSDPLLANGFNAIGHSQGGLLLRAYVERFNNPPVKTLISWAGPQLGVYGVPEWNAICPDEICHFLNGLFDKVLDDPALAEVIQDNISFAAYWRDIMHYEAYVKGNNFLKDINNEMHINATYKRNFESLEKLLLIYSTSDKIVVPRESPWFSFYPLNSTAKVVPWQDLRVPKLIGLDTLVDAKKVVFHSVPCPHQDIPRESCKEWYTKYTKPLLG